MDFKGGLAAFTVAAMRIAREPAPRTRDLILLSEADEEGGAYGTTWLAENHWDKIDAGVSINEGGWIFQGGTGGAKLMGITTIDKNSLSVTFRTRGTSTHSSRPLRDSALRRLTRALNRVENYDTAPRVTPVARTYLRAWARVSSGRTEQRLRTLLRTRRPAVRRRVADKLRDGRFGELFDGLVRNIFVPTIVGGGFRANVLPGTAEATVNMRMLPGQKPRPLIRELHRAVDDPKVEITPIVTGDATVEETLDAFDKRAVQPPSSIDTELYRSLVREGRRQWPGVEVTPELFEAGTDATPWRTRGIPVYGIYPYPISPRRPAGDARQRRADPDRVARAGHRHGHAGRARGGRVVDQGRGRDRPRAVVAAARADDPGPMLTTRTLGSALFGAFVGAWLGRAAFVWILDVPRTWEIVAVAGLGLLGLVVGVTAAAEEQRNGR